MPLYLLFLGSQSQNVKPNMKKLPANTRIRLKLLTHMCRITGSGFVLPASIQIIFDSLYGVNTNPKLKTLALNFAMNLVRTYVYRSIVMQYLFSANILGQRRCT